MHRIRFYLSGYCPRNKGAILSGRTGTSFARSGALLLIFALLLLSSCASAPEKLACAFPSTGADDDCIRRVAILPFNDHTDTDGLAELVRRRVYGHFSPLPYQDMEMVEVDRALRLSGLNDQESLYALSAVELGEKLNCDALIYGDVIEFQRIFAGVYSSMNVGAALQIWDARDGRKIWEDEYTARWHEGGVPLTLIDLPLITFRSGYNLRNEVKTQAVDELARRLVERMPPYANPIYAKSGSRSAGKDEVGLFDKSGPKSTGEMYEIQLGAFSDRDRAELFLRRVTRRGVNARMEERTDSYGSSPSDSSDGSGAASLPTGRRWHKIIMGPYPDRHTARQAVQTLQQRFPSCEHFIAAVPTGASFDNPPPKEVSP